MKHSIYFLFAFILFSCNNSNNKNDEDNKDSAKDKGANTGGKSSESYCFLKAEKRDSTIISLTITGNQVSGKMDWEPYQKDGAHGTLSGTKNANGEMDLIYDYTIEGSHQTETKVMKIDNNILWIKKGELVDPNNDGNLKYKDVATATYSEKLDKVDCK